MALSNIDIATILSMEESQTFDRKSVNIAPRDFSNHVCAFANADGGIIVVGISDKTKRIEGVDFRERQVNELLRVPMDFCMPTVPFVHEFVDCVDSTGRPNHVLVFHIEASPLVHENQAHDAYIRVGDKSKVLSYEDRMYREMEASGLPVPEYRQDSFILKAVVKNSGFALKKTGFESGKTGFALQKMGFGFEKTGFAFQKMEIVSVVLNSNFGKMIKEKMKKIIDEIDENQVIAAKDIMKILECKPTAATEMIKRMCALNLLKKLEGVGPGRYSLNDEINEI